MRLSACRCGPLYAGIRLGITATAPLAATSTLTGACVIDPTRNGYLDITLRDLSRHGLKRPSRARCLGLPCLRRGHLRSHSTLISPRQRRPDQWCSYGPISIRRCMPFFRG